jgi:hypothetical protein
MTSVAVMMTRPRGARAAAQAAVIVAAAAAAAAVGRRRAAVKKRRSPLMCSLLLSVSSVSLASLQEFRVPSSTSIVLL